MKTLGTMIMCAAGALLMTGCSPAFWGGAASGVVGTGAGYEVHASNEMKQLDDDLKAGRIDQREYDIRKDQIRKDAVFQ